MSPRGLQYEGTFGGFSPEAKNGKNISMFTG
jgi:hypothetical protein